MLIIEIQITDNQCLSLKEFMVDWVNGGLGYLSPLKYLKKIGVNCDNLIHE